MHGPTHHDDAPASTTPTPPAAFGGGHIAGLDGLRGGAVVVVVAYHLGLLRGGYLGVDGFFVLSGFLITSLLLAEVEGTGRVSLRRFWQRRIRRLVPAVLVLVPSVLVAAMVLEWPRTRFGDTSLDAFSTLTWWANWRQAIGAETYWDAETPDLFRHAWSLSIEEQFYVIWPLVLIAAAVVARRRGRLVRAAVGATAAVAFAASASWLVLLSHRLGDAELSRAYLGTDTRVLAPLAGCVLACWWSGRHDRSGRSTLPRGLLIAGAVAATTVLVTMVAAAGVAEPAMYRAGGFVVAALAATGLVLAVIAAGVGAPGQSPATRWTTTSVARYLGLRSYGIYLWSWPTQVLAERRFETAPRWSIVLAVVILSLVFAEGSFRLVEDPIRRGRGWATRPVVRRPAWALGLAVPVLTLLLVGLQAATPPAHEQVAATDSAAVALRTPPPTDPSTTPSSNDEPAGGVGTPSDDDLGTPEPDPSG